MLSFFCDLTNGQFASGFNDRSAPRHALSQNNDLPLRLYLLRPLGAARWPFSYDSWSGDPDVTAIVSLRSLATAAILASSPPLNLIKNGFEGILHTNTFEVADYLTTTSAIEKEALLSIDLIDGSGNKINPFRAIAVLRATPGTIPVAAGSILYFPEVTAYLGSGPEALQSKATLGKAGTAFAAWINGLFVVWRVEAGAADTDLDLGIIKPNDFDATTNPMNLVRGLGI
jgi:hypothetical protein